MSSKKVEVLLQEDDPSRVVICDEAWPSSRPALVTKVTLERWKKVIAEFEEVQDEMFDALIRAGIARARTPTQDERRLEK